MTGLRSAHLKSVCVLSIFLTATSLSTTTQTFAASPDSVIDGIPSLAACEKLGFDLRTDNDDGASGSGGRARKLGVMKFSAAPAPTESLAKPSPEPSIAVGPRLAAPLPAADAPEVDTERYPHATENPIKTVAE